MNGLPKTYDACMRLVDSQNAERYRHPADHDDIDACAEIIQTFRELLTPIFLFISKGRTERGMGLRGWVVLYVIRLDLLNGETQAQRARRAGVTQERIQRLVTEFRKMLPEEFRTARQRPEQVVDRMRRSQRASRAEVKHLRELGRTPQGRESPLGVGAETGSAEALGSPTRRV